MVQLSELLRLEQTIEEKAIYHKNQKPVVYVVGDVGGPGAEKAESPVYGVLGIGDRLKAYRPPEGYEIEQHYAKAALVREPLGDEVGRGMAHHL